MRYFPHLHRACVRRLSVGGSFVSNMMRNGLCLVFARRSSFATERDLITTSEGETKQMAGGILVGKIARAGVLGLQEKSLVVV